MTDSTILLVDADHETEEKIVSILEAEGYTVLTFSGRDISAGMAAEMTPSLIYLKPTEHSIEGFEICKSIHKTEKFRDVPIILLASLKGSLDFRYTALYGIVDYLKIPVNEDEIIAKTKKIIGSGSLDIKKQKEQSTGFMERPSPPTEETFKDQDKYSFNTEAMEISDIKETDIGLIKEESMAEEYPSGIRDKYAGDAGTNEVDEIGEPNEDYSYRNEAEKLKERLGAGGMRRRAKQHDLFIPIVVVISAISIVAAGFLLYNFFISPSKVKLHVMDVPSPQAHQQETTVLPLQEQQKQEHTVVESTPAEAAGETIAAVPETKPAGRPVYSVQLGAFKSEGSAEALAKTYKGRGYEAFTKKGTTKDSVIVYRVLIGRFESRDESLRLAAKILAKENAGTIVFSEGTKQD